MAAKVLSLEEAVSTYMHDGITMACGGFTGFVRDPVAFTWEAVRQGFKDIHYLGGHPGVHTFLLNAAKRIKYMEHCWMGYGELFGKLDMNAVRQYENGEQIFEDYSHAQVAFRQLAGAIGVPFIATYDVLGSDIENPNYDAFKRAGLRDGSNPRIAKEKMLVMDDPFYGKGKVILVPASNPELAVIHATTVGDMGTVRIRGVASGDKELAFSADKVVVTCEEIVREEELRRDPEHNLIPFIKVDAIVEIPYGAYPSSVPYHYDYDGPFIADTDKAQRSDELMNKWLEDWVYGPENWKAFLDKVGASRLISLKANTTTGYSTNHLRGKKPAPLMTKPVCWKR